jgi:hypothetical protein
MTASVHRLKSEQPHTESDRERILREAHENLAKRREEQREQELNYIEDPVQKWRREHEERDARWAEERRAEKRVERQQARPRQAAAVNQSDGWNAWLDARIEQERAFQRDVIAHVLANERAETDKDLKAAVAQLKAENRELKTMLMETVAALRSEMAKTTMELTRRIASVETVATKTLVTASRENAELKRQVDEQRELFAWKHPR